MQPLLHFFLSVALLTCMGVGCTPATVMAAQDEWRSVAGEWTGHYSNSVGEKGETSLSLREREDGTLRGTWDGVEVRGRRVNQDTIELRGETATRSYQITGTRDGRAMELKYIATRLNSSGTYEGNARLHRRH